MSGRSQGAAGRLVRRLAIAVTAIFLVLLGLAEFATGPRVPLSVVSGSENKGLEPLVTRWAADHGIDLTITYLGSVDISRELQKGAETEYDAVWPANSLWIELGDTQKVVRHRESILRSPVVLGLRKSIAEKLGWIGRKDITIQMIAAAAKAGEFRLAMTSATQSNSGASAYIGFLYALSGDPDLLTAENLADPKVQEGVRDLLGTVDRSSGSSGGLKDALVDNPDAYDAMFNYEAIVLEADEALAARGREPLYIIYPANGLSVADSPLGYVSKGDQAKEEAFLKLQAFLLSPEAQKSLLAAGRRAGLLGLAPDAVTAPIWRADWGVDTGRGIASVPVPQSDVIAEALRLYQTELRKPSLTIWVLDISGSMEGAPIDQLKQAMTLVLDPQAAAVNLLQPSARDITVILPFNNETEAPTTVKGDTPADLSAALRRVRNLEAGGGTDLYYALYQAFQILEPYARDGTLTDHLPAIIAMTDGASDTTNRDAFFDFLHSLSYGRDVPIHAIAFGDADEAQLKELNAASIGKLFDTKAGLAEALRSAKGYN